MGLLLAPLRPKFSKTMHAFVYQHLEITENSRDQKFGYAHYLEGKFWASISQLLIINLYILLWLLVCVWHQRQRCVINGTLAFDNFGFLFYSCILWLLGLVNSYLLIFYKHISFDQSFLCVKNTKAFMCLKKLAKSLMLNVISEIPFILSQVFNFWHVNY